MWSSLSVKSRTSTGFNSIRNKFNTHEIQGIYDEASTNQKHFGQNRLMKLNGIVNQENFIER
jgi:hypothetical protein